MQNHKPFLHPNYRPDIDGLRAWAVLAVVAFHAFPTRFTGGFIGVDVFFVISGYLISTIIYKNLDSTAFSFSEFYQRRINRIFPALIVVLLTCFGFGWFCLFAQDYQQLGQHISAAAAFVSNFALWSEAGYFDSSADTKPLLHLWSLGIEEQFYIVWPLFLWFSAKRRISLPVVTVFLGVISFLLNAYGVTVDEVATFYSPQTRFWELLVGCLLAWLTIHQGQRFADIAHVVDRHIVSLVFRQKGQPTVSVVTSVVALSGLTMLLFGFCRITKEFGFPGAWALVPVFAAVLIISAGPNNVVNRFAFSNKLVVWFGLISFPLYLWHWPLLSFARLIEDENPVRNIRIAAVALAIGLAWLTYRFIERPIRVRQSKQIAKCLVLIMVLIALIGFATVWTDGFPQRDIQQRESKSQLALKAVYEMSDMDKLYGPHSCLRYKVTQNADFFVNNGCLKIAHPGRPVVALLGDSHSGSLSLGLKPMLDEAHINLLQVSTGYCEPTDNNPDNRVCEEINQLVLSRLAQVPVDVLVIDAHWIVAATSPYFLGTESYLEHLNSLLSKYLSIGVKKILVVGQIPTWKGGLPKHISNNFLKKDLSIPKRTYQGVDPASLEMDRLMASAEYPHNVTYFSMKDLLCDASGCLTSVGDLGTDLIVWDYGHLTKKGSAFVSQALKGLMFKLLGLP
jgi:peptidoglycan/LPS O-acetylase OafA/YrhL